MYCKPCLTESLIIKDLVKQGSQNNNCKITYCCFVSWQGTLRDLFTIEPDTTEPQLTVTKTAPVEEIETEEESLEEPEAASTADSTEANTSKTTNGKMSQNLLEQVKT